MSHQIDADGHLMKRRYVLKSLDFGYSPERSIQIHILRGAVEKLSLHFHSQNRT